MNPIDMIKRSDIEPYELRRIAFGAILTALPSAIFQLQSAASLARQTTTLQRRQRVRLDPYSIGYLATAFTCFAVSGLKEE